MLNKCHRHLATQRGAGHLGDVRLAPTEAERRHGEAFWLLFTLFDAAIKKTGKQVVQINYLQFLRACVNASVMEYEAIPLLLFWYASTIPETDSVNGNLEKASACSCLLN